MRKNFPIYFFLKNSKKLTGNKGNGGTQTFLCLPLFINLLNSFGSKKTVLHALKRMQSIREVFTYLSKDKIKINC